MKPPPKTGRFNALRVALQQKGVRDPDALADAIGKKKVGKARFQAMATKAKPGFTAK